MGVAISKSWEDKTFIELHLFVEGTRGADQAILGKKLLLNYFCRRVIKACASELNSQALKPDFSRK
jgi:hypothetical protein